MAPCARRRVISSSNSGHECEERDQLRKAVEIDGPIESPPLSRTSIKKVANAEIAFWWSLVHNVGLVVGSAQRHGGNSEGVNMELTGMAMVITTKRASNSAALLG